jgi:hypothetical protein
MSDPRTPSRAERERLRALAEQDIAEMRAAAQEYFDGAHACDTPALRRFRRPRNLRGIALTDAANRYASLLAALDEGERERALLRELIDTGDCYYDHHGYCQAHALQPRPCPHERAKALLASKAEEPAKG